MKFNKIANIYSDIKQKKHTVDSVILWVAGFLLLFCNKAFFDNIIQQYSLSMDTFSFIVSLAIFLFALTVILLGLVSSQFTLKPLLIVVFFVAAVSSYFMNSYNIVVDTTMLTNVMETDAREAGDLLSVKLLLSLVFLGLLPSLWVLGLNLKPVTLRQALLSRVKLMLGAVMAIGVVVMLWSPYYASFFREHKHLRYYANPVTAIYSMGKFASENLHSDANITRQQIGLDAKIPDEDKDRELIILVLGETARADHFSLNGYSRKTNPLLENYPVVNFPNMTSCATSTALSVPCMFSNNSENEFDIDDADYEESLLDVLDHADIHMLWRDNNSSSKGVAAVLDEEDYRDPAINSVCDDECRDIGMLIGLDEWIEQQEDGDVFIVLHQMGNHGPAYYKRYPEAFEVFSPVCRSNDLQQCSVEEINNAYDNAIRYTDYFLSEVINFLQGYDEDFETAMFYVSDHGESLGEHGLYLHGMPNFMAPESQRHVPALMWFGKNYEIDLPLLQARSHNAYSHDNFFHTVLGLMEIETKVYDPALDIIADAHLQLKQLADAKFSSAGSINFDSHL